MRCFCLTSVCLSRKSGVTREQRGLGRLKLAHRLPTSHAIRTPLESRKVKGQGHQTALAGCSSHYIIYMNDTIIITRASRCLLITNIHGARRAGRRRRNVCMGWSWAAACGVKGGAYCAASRTACYAPPLIGRGIKRCFCLTSVCLTSVCRVHRA